MRTGCYFEGTEVVNDNSMTHNTDLQSNTSHVHCYGHK